MKNDANHIGNSLQKYISKYNLEQVRPIGRMRPIYYLFSKLSLKQALWPIVQSGLWSKKYCTCALKIHLRMIIFTGLSIRVIMLSQSTCRWDTIGRFHTSSRVLSIRVIMLSTSRWNTTGSFHICRCLKNTRFIISKININCFSPFASIIKKKLDIYARKLVSLVSLRNRNNGSHWACWTQQTYAIWIFLNI
jgi:hypothetical protein